ncbi:MAG: hypothetical protein COB37_11350 [Kordiimonadales bacterium]|nr:MAG: hypothetical protein COB37_11350 [Kordiimonadales bacterium]
MITTILVAILMAPAPWLAAPDQQSLLKRQLEQEQITFTEAKSLYNKAVGFLLAEKVYKTGHKLYSEDPAHLAPIVFAYAEASARYKEPVALSLFKEALVLYGEAHDAQAPAHISPLLAAAEEATRRNEPDLAYAWYDKAKALLNVHYPQGSFFAARMHVGLATLYWQVGDFERAAPHVRKAWLMLDQFPAIGIVDYEATLYFWLGEAERAAGWHKKALHAYEGAFRAYKILDPNERRIWQIYKRRTELNYKLGNQEIACQNTVKADTFRPWITHVVSYDPTGYFSHEPYQQETGQVAFRLNVGADCRAHNLEIIEVIGISEKEAYEALSKIIYTPGHPKAGRKNRTVGLLEGIWSVYTH